MIVKRAVLLAAADIDDRRPSAGGYCVARLRPGKIVIQTLGIWPGCAGSATSSIPVSMDGRFIDALLLLSVSLLGRHRSCDLRTKS
jgi:hypothetical protein